MMLVFDIIVRQTTWFPVFRYLKVKCLYLVY